MDDNDLPQLTELQEGILEMFFGELLIEIEVVHKHVAFIKSLHKKLNQNEVSVLMEPWLK